MHVLVGILISKTQMKVMSLYIDNIFENAKNAKSPPSRMWINRHGDGGNAWHHHKLTYVHLPDITHPLDWD